MDSNFSSGIPALDEILQGVREGDNIVFQVDKIEDYIHFANGFSLYALEKKQEIIYLRFAQHACLLTEKVCSSIKFIDLNPEMGFEHFISQIIDVIEKYGHGVCYIFDSLSDLAVDWYSDVMLSNFFMLICPYLYDFKTVTFFALFRHLHDQQTFTDIHKTAQVVIDVYNHKDSLYIHPIKVIDRFSPTLFMLHKWDDLSSCKSSFKTIKESSTIAEILTEKHYQWLNFAKEFTDAWHLSFYKAQETLRGLILGEISLKQSEPFKNKLLQSSIVQDDLILILAMQFFSLEDLLGIRKRMIGTGFIGGKSVGMLLAQSILKQDPKWEDKLETQDSFFIGSEVYYSFLVRNGCWWMRRKLSDPETFLEGRDEARTKILAGTFPDYVLQPFRDMLNYFGQSPIIVRSSSLQEDAYGHAFSGKYESIFLANQGTPDERMEEFLDAVRTVYASTVDEDALIYRKNRKLLDKDEQMAVLVQRVSGSSYGNYFYPQLAGVGFSLNPFVWEKKIDPKAGFLRLVFGLGTRAVDRTDDDYTRLIALNQPKLRPETNAGEIRQYSQWKIDVLDLKENKLVTRSFQEIAKDASKVILDLSTTKDEQFELQMEKLNRTDIFPFVLTFNKLLSNKQFIADMREILETLEKAYVSPVDIEFTVNFSSEQNYKINILQCRPFQVKTEKVNATYPKEIEVDSVIFETTGPIIGSGISTFIDRIVYIIPREYGILKREQKYSIARLIGKINQLDSSKQLKTILIGPGRWGTSTPSLGIPVRFAEINNIAVLGEISEILDNLIPDISLGTHFFNDLVEREIIYFALDSDKRINRKFFENSTNVLKTIIPEAKKWEFVVKVIECKNSTMNLHMDPLSQKGICYFTENNTSS